MNILWLSWKDNDHPQAGGAELVSCEIRKRLVRDGHNVRLITSKPKSESATALKDGVEINRVGNRYTVYIKSKSLYTKEMKGWANIIIDEMNTIPFLGYRYDNTPTILLTYQLAREVWFHQITFPVSLIGYLIEPLYLKFMSNNKYLTTITESESTKNDLIKYGFLPNHIKTFRIGMDIKPLPKIQPKTPSNTILCLGSVRPMKQTLHVVKAFELSRDSNSKLKLNIVGDYSGRYGKRVFAYAKKSRHAKAITFHGKVDNTEKQLLLQSADAIAITSVKEGWGIIATEAASQGVPAIAYATDGLRDSVLDNKTGLLVQPGNYKELSVKILELLSNPPMLKRMRAAGLENSRQFTFTNSYNDFCKELNISN